MKVVMALLSGWNELNPLPLKLTAILKLPRLIITLDRIESASSVSENEKADMETFRLGINEN